MKCMSVIAMTILVALAGCDAPARSADCFEAHPDEAERVLVECTVDEARGDECNNARMGAARAYDAARRQAADERGGSGKILPSFGEAR